MCSSCNFTSRCSPCVQWLVCYARKHGLVPVLPSMKCSLTDAARSDWPLPDRCSWYMRYSFPGDAASYRDHSFLFKFTSLAKSNVSFTSSVSEITSFSMRSVSSDNHGSLGSLLIVSPKFWLESPYTWIIRDWLPFLHEWLPLEHRVASTCASLVENPRTAGCC